MVYLLLAGLATPLVLSVHSVVSWDFAMAQLPGWHSTIFAPYFVAGAIFSGVAMVMTLLIPMRRMLGIEDLLTAWHFDNLAKVILLTSLVVTYSYITESLHDLVLGRSDRANDISHALLRAVGAAVLDDGVVQLRDPVVAVLAAHPG